MDNKLTDSEIQELRVEFSEFEYFLSNNDNPEDYEKYVNGLLEFFERKKIEWIYSNEMKHEMEKIFFN